MQYYKYRRTIIVDNDIQRIRTNVSISKNKPFSEARFKKFPPKDYPLVLSITFSKKGDVFKEHLKSTLDIIPKDKSKYRNVGKYINTFDCYFKDIDSMRPLLNDVLRHTEMFTLYVSSPDRRIFVKDILSKANKILSNKEIGI